MNKRILISLLCLLLFTYAIPSFAGIGIKGGLIQSNIITDDLDEGDSLSLYSGGLCFENMFIGPIGIQTELLYAQKGYKTSIGILDATIRGNYIELPVMLKVNLPLNPLVNLNILGGGYAAYLLDATADINGTESDVADQVTKLDYGLTFGVGAKFSKFFVELRYTQGLTTIDDSGNNEIYNTTTGISGGIIF